MNRLKKPMALLLLSLAMAALASGPLAASLPACALAEEDPVVVRVGEFEYPLSVVQTSLDSQLELSELLRGEAPSQEEREGRAQGVVDSFVDLGLIETKLTEAGRNEFTDAERRDLETLSRSKYEELWQSLYAQMTQSGQEVEEADVTEAMEGAGYTYEAIYAEYELSERQQRAIDLFCDEVVLTQAMVDDYYEEQFLGPDREAYADDIERYEQEILATGNESFYTPGGYRYIRQIVLKVPSAALKDARHEQARLNRNVRAMGTALQDLTVAATKAESWDDLAEAKEAYDLASQEMSEAQKAYNAKLEAEALPLVQPTVDEIMEQYNAGIDFKTLVKKYSTDTTERNANGDGYPFHPQSTGWPEGFAEAASALEKPGDVSEPVLTEQGIHIICYVGDVPAGDHELTDEEREMLNAAALRYYQTRQLEDLADEWRKDYEIETHPELVKY